MPTIYDASHDSIYNVGGGYSQINQHCRQCAIIGCKLKQNANEGCNSCASLAGLVLSFIACFILLVIAPLGEQLFLVKCMSPAIFGPRNGSQRLRTLFMSPLGDIYSFASWQNRHFGGVFRRDGSSTAKYKYKYKYKY